MKACLYVHQRPMKKVTALDKRGHNRALNCRQQFKSTLVLHPSSELLHPIPTQHKPTGMEAELKMTGEVSIQQNNTGSCVKLPTHLQFQNTNLPHVNQPDVILCG